MTFLQAAPAWYWLLAFGAAFLYTYLLYSRDRISYPKPGWKWLAAACRAISVALLIALLINPFLKTEKKISEKPLVLLVRDNSSSLSAYRKQVDETEKKLQELSERLADEADWRWISFGEKVAYEKQLLLNEKTSDFSRLFTELGKRFGNQPVAGMVLSSDGLYNRGQEPLYDALKLGIPIYTIPQGDSSTRMDAAIERLRHNSLVFKGRSFPVMASLSAKKLAGKQAELKIFDLNGQNPQQIASKSWRINSERQFEEIELEVLANQPGIRKYRIELQLAGQNENKRNNSREFYVEVIDDETRILLLANSPHPDVSVIRRALELSPQNKVSLLYARNQSEVEQAILQADVVILHQLPATTPYNWQKTLQTAQKPLWFIIGQQSSLTAFNQWQSQIRIQARSANFNKVNASESSDFELFSLPEIAEIPWTQLPPLDAPFGQYESTVNMRHLLNQKIGQVATDFPLWSFNRQTSPRYAFTLGEGIWRWQLALHQDKVDKDPLGEIIRKTVAYLAIKAEKRPLVVKSQRAIYQEQEALVFEAELYNPSFELTNTPELKMELTDQNGKQYPFIFNRLGERYVLEAGNLPPGDYRYEATTRLLDQDHKASGVFSIAALALEDMRQQADFDLLANMSEQSGGKTLTTEEIASLEKYLTANNGLSPVSYYEQSTSSLIQFVILMFIILLLLTLEWFIRRYAGAY
jgi:hypothetical protein